MRNINLIIYQNAKYQKPTSNEKKVIAQTWLVWDWYVGRLITIGRPHFKYKSTCLVWGFFAWEMKTDYWSSSFCRSKKVPNWNQRLFYTVNQSFKKPPFFYFDRALFHSKFWPKFKWKCKLGCLFETFWAMSSSIEGVCLDTKECFRSRQPF